MEVYTTDYMLTEKQEEAIVRAIHNGKEKYEEIIGVMPVTATNNYQTKLLSDLINTEVDCEVKRNPHLGLQVIHGMAGSHSFICLHEEDRNIKILIQKFYGTNCNYTPARYRARLSATNLDYVMNEGFNEGGYFNHSAEDHSKKKESFCIIVSYNENAEVIYEGALFPNQKDWIYKCVLSDLSKESERLDLQVCTL